MTTKKHKNLHEWLNLGVDFNPGSAKYGEMTSIIEAKLKAAPTGKLAHVDHRIIGNCHAGENNPQIFEITKDKKIVWQWNEWDLVGNGLACWQVLNDEQSALVRKKLAALEK